MDQTAALSITIVAAALFLALVLELFAWIRVRYETRSEIKACQTVQAQATTEFSVMREAFNAWHAKGFKELQAAVGKAQADAEKANLRADAIAESLAALNAKTTAREREEQKRARREAAAADTPTGEEGAFEPAPVAVAPITNGRTFFRRKQG